MNKKASIMDITVWIIVGFITVLFFTIFTFGFHILTTNLADIGTIGSVNITAASASTFQQVDSNLFMLRSLAFIMFFTMGVSILISNFLIKANPVFFIVYIFMIVINVVFSVVISNVYGELMSNSSIGTTLLGFKGMGYIMLHLPVWITVFGFLGAIFLFAGIMRDREMGGGI